MAYISNKYAFVLFCAPATGSSAVTKCLIENNIGKYVPSKTIENYFQFSNQTFFKDRLLVDTFFRKQSSDVKHARTLMSLDTTPTTEQNRFLAVLVEAISQYKI